MSPEEYADALAGGQPVAYHTPFCESNRSLASMPCDCGAVEHLRVLRELHALRAKADKGTA